MQQFEVDGVIYQDLGDGNVKVIGYADQPPVDPAFQYEGPKAQAEAQRATSQATITNAQVPFAGTVAQAEARKAEAEAEIARLKAEEATRNSQDDPQKEKQKQISDELGADSALKAIRNARILASKSMATGNTFGSPAFGYVPILGQDNANLKAKISGLQGGIINDMLMQLKELSASGASGYGSLSETEGARIASSIAALDQMQEGPELVAELDRLEKHYLNGKALLAGDDPRSPEVQKKYGIDKTTSFIDGGTQQEQYRLGVSPTEQTDHDKKFAALAQSAFDRGASASELRKLATDYGYTAKNYGPDLDEAIKYRDAGGRGARLGAPESGYNDPNIAERARQAIGSSPVGGYFGGAANALSLGFMDEIQGGAKTLTQGGDLSENIAEADLIKTLGAQANPKSNLAGNLTGGILGAMATGGIAGAGQGAVRTLAPRAIAGDAMFGAGFGAGENNQNRLGGAIMGAGAGAGGGIAGRGATRKLGGLIGGSSNQPARTLYEKGVTLTPGQIRGGAAMQKESRLAGMPGSDVPITRAQERGYQQFNKAAFDEGLQPVGGRVSNIGELGVEEAREAAQKGYGFLDDVNLQEDKQIIDAIGGRIAQSQEIPNLGDQTTFGLQKSIDGFFDESGQLTGRNFQNIQQNLTRRAGKFDNSLEAVGPDAASVLRGAKDDFGDMAARQAPEIMPQLRGANQAYGNYKTLQEAVSKGKNTGGVFSPAQLGMAAETAARKYGGKHATTQRPFFELQRAGQQVLPQTVPDSGTAGRASVDGILNTGKNMARGATNRAIYNEPVLELMNKMAFERPEVMQAIGEAVKRRSRLGGLIGAPALLPAVN